MNDLRTATVTAIMKLNPSARPEFLDEFSAEDLEAYLRRLKSIPYRAGYDNTRPATQNPGSPHWVCDM